MAFEMDGTSIKCRIDGITEYEKAQDCGELDKAHKRHSRVLCFPRDTKKHWKDRFAF